MAERVLRGRPASPGRAAGPAWHLAGAPAAAAAAAPADPDVELAHAATALEAAAAELDALAAGLSGDEAEIVATGAMMARDPALADAVAACVRGRGLGAPAALAEAAEAQAAFLAALDDPMLAARADDVRSVGRRAARHLAGAGQAAPPPGAVVVAPDAGPADVVELAAVASAFALAGGGETAHAAIVARSLGLPMAAGVGPAVLDAAPGDEVVVDGDAGEAVLAPTPARADAARAATEARTRARERATAERDLPAVTRDGRAVAVLSNVAGVAEVDVALAAGAEGVGLLRTELGFLDTVAWPSEAEHRAALAPVLGRLAGRVATVRVLDFGGDKTPPFLRGKPERGIALLLAAPDALEAQLRAIAATAGEARLRVLLPLVEDPEQVRAVRSALGAPTRVGAMIETPAAAARADEIAAVCDFLSVGTNDLTAATLGVDRFAPGGTAAHDPRVLAHIAAALRAAAAASIALEVCGEAASDPRTLPLLLGLGADELSVGAARVGTVRAWVRAVDQAECERLAAAALRAPDAAAVAALVAPVAERLELLERGDEPGEARDGGRGIVAVGPQA